MTEPIIEFRDIHKSFGDNEVLRGVDLAIHPGDMMAIIGKSGEGKSVLIKHAVGLLTPDAGEIRVNGSPLSHMSRAERSGLRRRFSYMFQENALFDSMTAFQNIALPLKEKTRLSRPEIAEKVLDKMRQLDVEGFSRSYPSQLSGGMKKRVALARALVTDPEIIFFDEPTTGLDPIRKNAVHRLIADYQHRFGFTAVVVSHEIPDIFFIARRVVMLDEGKVVYDGPSGEIEACGNPVVRNFIHGLEGRHDSLTGMAPHAQGQRRYLEEIARMGDEGPAFSIVLLTVENLYEINRMAGYEAEQGALMTFAEQIRRHLRITDICSRIGLNQIMLLLPRTDEQGARRLCGKLAEELSHCRIEVPDYPGFTFSVSAGIVEARMDKPIEQIVQEARVAKDSFYEFKVCELPGARE